MIRTLIASTMLMTGVLASAAHAETTYIHAGHLMAVPGEGYATEQTVIIEDGRILSVEDGYIAPEEGVELIDLSEGYVLPGLIDSHVHLTSEFSPDMRVMMLSESEVDEALDGAMYARRTVEAGFTTVQDVGSSPEAIFSLRDAIMEGDLTGPRIRAAGASISPTGGHGDVNGLSPALMNVFESEFACNGADDCRRSVRLAIRGGADVIKITATGGVLSNTRAGLGQQFFDDELVAIVEAAESMGRRVTAHAHGVEGINAALRAGVHSIEHGSYLNDETIALFLEHDAVLVPTVIAGITVTGWVEEPWLPAPSREKAAIVGPLMLDMLRRAHDGGVRIAFGTDTGVSRHGENAQEFLYMVEAGFEPEEAIRAATVVAAEHVELESEIGTIESGKSADIIAVMGDPVEDISELLDVDFVMARGAVYVAP
ncbi:amidohydrolase family protein [Ponticaulis sp.]|uniref:metal-dependent hydrolase family protein n=1 Tax=Ponticaulis sp. TaxID=2020902 RepID=UPI000B6FD79B|nr:amidohydrolase family protein [Ponticaulis sp.]MAI88900.1 Xaa-Pro dipeptidase [Ponticaulis sp.]OUY01590.1 MAG: Xaa-Pro dipeptidase [Hyphomonadaceae bacterium TMED5]|tara:strand:+ start:21115 stop:22398 length:1284 start_codon:yes stop_codon:yes gene_type:complete